MKKIVMTAILLIAVLFLSAQNQIEGKVLELTKDGDVKPIYGANVYWEESDIGTITDIYGSYSINEAKSFPATLSVSYIGYTFDSKEVKDNQYIFYLKRIVELDEVNVEGTNNTTKYSLIEPVNIQTITKGELHKAACCNLSEAFETNNTVDIIYSDAVSGLKKIQMLGLDGSYIQITNETMPLIRGLQRSYGLSYIPGSWIESIQIIKGMGSVVNGYESFTGQINLEYFKPINANRIFWNLYTNSDGKIENNILLAKKSGKWRSNLFTHISYFDKEIDQNHGSSHNHNTAQEGDGFLDIPKVKQFSFLNRWQYFGSDDYRCQINIKGLIEDRIAGHRMDIVNPYILDIDNKLLNIYAKIGTLNKNGKSIALQASGLIHKQDAHFGNNIHNGVQQSWFINLMRDRSFNANHSIRYGFSTFFDRYSEYFDGNINLPYENVRNDLVSGLYTEHIYGNLETLKLVTGIRTDYYNISESLYFSPRTNLRYNPSENTVLRLSIGKAFRIPQPLAENFSYLNSSRFIHIEDVIDPERALNYGINATHCFYLFSREGRLNVDIYRTQFQNQIIVDVENQDSLLFYNLDGKSYANSIQIDLDYELFDGLQLRIGYKINNSMSTFNGEQKSVPLLPDYRALFNLAYVNNSNKWFFDFTTNYIGSSRIPEHNQLDFEYSDPFSLVNFNITRKLDKFDLYFGGENIFKYTQENPILGGDNWSSNFDASLIYAPVHGRMIYLGLRYRLE